MENHITEKELLISLLRDSRIERIKYMAWYYDLRDKVEVYKNSFWKRFKFLFTGRF